MSFTLGMDRSIVLLLWLLSKVSKHFGETVNLRIHGTQGEGHCLKKATAKKRPAPHAEPYASQQQPYEDTSSEQPSKKDLGQLYYALRYNAKMGDTNPLDKYSQLKTRGENHDFWKKFKAYTTFNFVKGPGRDPCR